jgi:hypothetical protein
VHKVLDIDAMESAALKLSVQASKSGGPPALETPSSRKRSPRKSDGPRRRRSEPPRQKPDVTDMSLDEVMLSYLARELGEIDKEK